jgi:hypothetical protein
VPHALVPTLSFALGVSEAEGRDIRSMLLDVQVQIDARRRSYDARAHDRLFELFGPVEQWGRSLRTLLWTRTTVVVGPFRHHGGIDLPVTCTYDLEVAAASYFASLEGGEVPVELLFSGTMFYRTPNGLQTALVSWSSEAVHRLPLAVWRQAMDQHFSGAAWLRLSRETLDRLHAYKSAGALPTWEAAFDSLLERAEG